MSRIEQGYMPLSRVEAEEPANIYVDLALPPFVDKDRIGVNIQRVDRLKNLAGINVLFIAGSSGNETSSDTPNIAGQNSDGSAFATKSTTKTEMPTYADFCFTFKNNKVMKSRQVMAGVKFNLDEISQRISQKNEEVRSVKPWAKEIDKGLRATIQDVGITNLTSKWHDTTPTWLYFTSQLSFANLIALGTTNILTNKPDVGIIDLSMAGILVGMNNLGKIYDPNYRFSLFLGHQMGQSCCFKNINQNPNSC